MDEPRNGSVGRWTVALAGVAFVLHLATARGYGYFRDELYYLACGRHPGLGYVDHPPLIGWIAAVTRFFLGDSLFAIRLPSALAAAGTVWLAGATARELGGAGFARTLTALAALLAPICLALFSILSMNAFDVLIWAAAWWILARMLRTGEPQLWLALGAVLGLGLENKISVLFLGFGMVVGLLAGRRWDLLRGRWVWLGGVLALLLFLPHLAWQQAHGWPTLEFMQNARQYKMLALGPGAFLGEVTLTAGPVMLPLWLLGLVFFLGLRRGRAYRPLGWAFLAILVVMIALHAKPYYAGAAFTVVFAGGAVALEGWTGGRRGRLVRGVIVAVVVAGGLLAAPLAKPLLPVETYIRYAESLGFGPSSGERHEVAALPQFFADMHGWPELVQTVADVYWSLPPGDREKACVFAQNYGQAGAVDLFGPDHNLPRAICAHNSYYLWGPGDCTGEVVIVIGAGRERLEEVFESVETAAVYTCDYCMPYEDEKVIYVARRLKMPIRELWPSLKEYI
jgi:hypothetical protein